MGALSEAISSTAPPSRQAARPHREREVEFAEFETRIRKFILELLEPTIHRTAQLEITMESAKEEQQGLEQQVARVVSASRLAERQISVVEQFREEMAKWDSERRNAETKTTEDISSMKQELDTFRYSLERKDSTMNGLQRTADRMTSELGKVHAASEDLRQHVERRIAQQSKVINGAKTDLEVKLIALEGHFNKLSDELWGEETGLAKVTSDLGRTNSIVANHSEEMKVLCSGKANLEQFESIQEEVNEMIREALGSVGELKKTVATVVSDVKAHFHTATNQIAAHNASMLTEVRSSYQEELKHAAELRSDIVRFMEETQSHISHLEDVVGRSQDQTESMVREVRQEVEELNTRRKRDKHSSDMETKSLKTQISGVNGSSDHVIKCIEHLSSVIWVMIQSDRAACALGQQDDTDRAKVALMGYRDAPTAKGGGAAKRSTTPRPGGADDGGGGGVVNVDQRCLSCSGQAQTVLAGFKMACLQYAPGPVTFGKKVYKRTDLMGMRTQLLEQAHEALSQGPVDFDRKEMPIPRAFSDSPDDLRATSVTPNGGEVVPRATSSTPTGPRGGTPRTAPLPFLGSKGRATSSGPRGH